MSKQYFSEAIKVLDGKFCNLSYHQNRMDRTSKNFFGIDQLLDLSTLIIPAECQIGLFKCRVVYSDCIDKVEYNPYQFRSIKSLKLMISDTIDYAYKSVDREALADLFLEKGNCDDILIVKDGYITDTSFSNVVFRNASGLYTPSTYLLAGTKRQMLLERGVVKETDIKLSDLSKYDKLYIINAMIDLEDNISIDISDLIGN